MRTRPARKHTTRIPTCAPGFRKPHAHTLHTHAQPQRPHRSLFHIKKSSTHQHTARPRDRPIRPTRALPAASRRPPCAPRTPPASHTCCDLHRQEIWIRKRAHKRMDRLGRGTRSSRGSKRVWRSGVRAEANGESRGGTRDGAFEARARSARACTPYSRR